MMMIINLIIGILGAGIGSGIMAILQAKMQRKWQLEDRSAEKLDAQTAALKMLMVDRVKGLTREYIAQGWIAFDDKEDVKEMFDAFKALGGNGALDTAMSEINKLEVHE